MRTRKMKVLLCEVINHEGLMDVASHIGSISMSDRVKIIGGYDMKMEILKEKRVGRDKVIFMDFCKHREEGPGRTSLKSATEEFDLDQYEAFGEITAILYSERFRCALIQYNHYGPRYSSIAMYLNQLRDDSTGEGFIFKPYADDSVLERASRMTHGKMLEFSYSYHEFAKNDGGNLSFKEMVSLRERPELHPDIVKIIFQSEPHSKKTMKVAPMIKEFLSHIRKFGKGGDLRSAKVKGLSDDGKTIDELDLISPRFSEEYEMPKLKKAVRLYSFEARCQALEKAYQDCKSRRLIPFSNQ